MTSRSVLRLRARPGGGIALCVALVTALSGSGIDAQQQSSLFPEVAGPALLLHTSVATPAVPGRLAEQPVRLRTTAQDSIRKSTLSERLLAGWLGGIAFSATAAAIIDEPLDETFWPLWAAGSGTGVWIATSAREGGRTLRTFGGAAAGTAVWWLLVHSVFDADLNLGSNGAVGLVVIYGGSLLGPIGGSLGHTGGR